MRELIDEGAVTMVFQPVVTLPGGKVSACEALGRGRFQDLPESPVELFDSRRRRPDRRYRPS